MTFKETGFCSSLKIQAHSENITNYILNKISLDNKWNSIHTETDSFSNVSEQHWRWWLQSLQQKVRFYFQLQERFQLFKCMQLTDVQLSNLRII